MPGASKAQIATVALQHRQKTFLAGYARLGNVSQAAEVAQIDRVDHYRWLETDVTYPERFADAERQFNDRLLGKGTAALFAQDDESLANHPNLFFFLVKGRMPEYRDNQPLINVDARSLNISAGDLAGVVAELARQRETGQLPAPEGD